MGPEELGAIAGVVGAAAAALGGVLAATGLLVLFNSGMGSANGSMNPGFTPGTKGGSIF